MSVDVSFSVSSSFSSSLILFPSLLSSLSVSLPPLLSSTSLDEAAADLPIVMADNPDDSESGHADIYGALEQAVHQEGSEDVYTGKMGGGV